MFLVDLKHTINSNPLQLPQIQFIQLNTYQSTQVDNIYSNDLTFQTIVDQFIAQLTSIKSNRELVFSSFDYPVVKST